MYEDNLALNNPQRLICHKTKPNYIYLLFMFEDNLSLNNLQWLISHNTKPNQIIYLLYICLKRIRY